MLQKGQGKMNNRGFSLIELIVVMVMLGILLAIAAPSMFSWRESAKVKEVAQDILGGLRQARSLAVTNNQNITASLDLTNHRLSYNGIVREFPTDIAIAADNDISLENTGSIVTIFAPQGSCSSTMFVRINGDQDLEIKIDSTATGLARMQSF